MPKESEGERRVRKGTRSCQECRNRKLKCTWPGDDSPICNNCAARSRPCIAQGSTLRTFETAPVTARERIRQVEDEVRSLWSVVRRLETNAQGGTTHGPSNPGSSYRTPQEFEQHAEYSQTLRASSFPSEGTRPTRDFAEDGDDDSMDTAESELDGFELSASHQPSHLRQLFNNDLLGSQNRDDTTWDERDYRNARPAVEMYLTIARRQLQRLLPSREDVTAIAGFTFSWMSIYTAMFPRIRMQTTAEEMLAQYDELCSPTANPMSLANLLVSLALTIRQIPTEEVRTLAPGLRNVSRFVDEVSETVDRTIASNDTLAATLDGIETSLLFTRLAMVSVDVRKMWIRLRRIISLAELIGLPRASKSLATATTQHHRSAAALWESICVVDRLAGMMFNLPSATKAYPISHKSVVSADGTVDVQAYIGRLTEIALSVQDLDSVPTSEQQDWDQLSKVFAIDEKLRSLNDMTPSAWWSPLTGQMTPERLVQYWSAYFTVRTHLRLALADNESGRFRLSYNTCLNASQNMARRYIDLRPLLPSGFFACRITDFQILTAAVFLIFDCSKTQSGPSQPPPQPNTSTTLIEQLADALKTASKRTGGDFAGKSVVAIRSLQKLMQGRYSNDGQKEMTLNVPMLGKISVDRRVHQTQPEHVHATQTITGWEQSGGIPEDNAQILDGAVAAPFWSMDVLNDDFSFLGNAHGGDEFGLSDYGFSFAF
ncbi:hypothetical protein Q7P35_010789 [Cladosporium inversicolor]